MHEEVYTKIQKVYDLSNLLALYIDVPDDEFRL